MKMIDEKIKFAVLFLFTGFIVSCGFHLRGAQDLSAELSEVQIVGLNKHDELMRNLTSALSASQVKVLDESNSILKINYNRFSKRVLSLDSAGRANQYELMYQLNFTLIEKVTGESMKYANKSQGNQVQFIEILPAKDVTEKREYLFDANQILAKADEELRLKNDMRQSAIIQVIRRLAFSLKSSKSGKNSVK